jgi:arsenate reductase
MLFICYPKCTTCEKARKWLKENGVPYDYRDIKLNNPTYEEMKRWTKENGLPLKKFFNTSGILYKSLGLKDKLATMSEEEQLQLLSTDGMLIKRPLLIDDAFVLVGFKEKEWAECLKKTI